MIIGLPQSMIFEVSRACRAIMPAGARLGRGSPLSPTVSPRNSIPLTRWAATAAGYPAGWSSSMSWPR
jgi:hypothetical protein